MCVVVEKGKEYIATKRIIFGNVVSKICVCILLFLKTLVISLCPMYLCIVSACVSRIYVVGMHTDLSELLPLHLHTQQA